GPYSDWIAYGMGLEPASGIAQLTGYPGGPPMRSGISLTDPLTGLAATVAVLTALRHRRRTGGGQGIGPSQHEAATPRVEGGRRVWRWSAGGRGGGGSRSWTPAPQGVFRCRGDDEWTAITCHDDAEWERLCDAARHPEWKQDERFADLLARHANHDALDDAIA